MNAKCTTSITNDVQTDGLGLGLTLTLTLNATIDFKHGLKFEGRANLTSITNDVQTDVKLGQI